MKNSKDTTSSFLLKQKNIQTPAFVYDLDEINKKVKFLSKIKKRLNCKVLYSLKALPLTRILEEMEFFIDGFSVSSLFEAKLAKQTSKNKKEIHFVSPGIKNEQWEDLSEIVSYLTFNSFEQASFFEDKMRKSQSYGLRLNPEISFIEDDRYNPCSKISKLGVTLPQLKKEISENSNFFNKIDGIHLHTNCESSNFSQLTQTFLKIKNEIGDEINKFKWINLGGGYLFNKSTNLSLFYELIESINKNYHFDNIIIEPGNFIIKDSGYLVSSVIDIFQRNGKNIAVLDTTVNHLPEVFEYQYEPNVANHHASYKNNYLLAGCSCLAGDIFGTYSFENNLEIGSKVIFEEIGSYSLVKAHTFNGINLPDIYCIKNNTGLEKIKSFTFEDYKNYYGG